MLFKDVLVDDELKRRLVVLVKENRISHAQLFLSQEGSNSIALAVAYAQYIMCSDKKEWDSCGECPSCKKISHLYHPDLHFIFPNSTTADIKKDSDSEQLINVFIPFVIENNYHISLNRWLEVLGGENKQASINIRDCSNIIKINNTRSYEGGFKIYIIWMIERMHHTAAPKLLKTLEEPEPNTLFILITEDSNRILPTILSRTQLVKIPRIKDSEIAAQLEKEFNLPKDICYEIASISEGNYIKSLSLLKHRDEYKIQLKRFDDFFGSCFAIAANKSIAEIKFLEIRKLISELKSEGRETQKQFLTLFTQIIRNLLLAATNYSHLIFADEEEKKIIEKYNNSIKLSNVTAIVEECNKAIYHIERNGNSELVLMDFYLKVASKIANSKS